MTEVNNTIFNNNFLSPVGFKFIISRLPIFEFLTQSFDFPGVALARNATNQKTPFANIPIPGNTLEYDEIGVEFKLDEYLVNYLEIYDWMKALGIIQNTNGYYILQNVPLGSEKGVKSDAALVTLDAHLNPVVRFYFHDLFPIALTGFTFDSKNKDIDYITAKVRFAYSYFDYEVLKTASA